MDAQDHCFPRLRCQLEGRRRLDRDLQPSFVVIVSLWFPLGASNRSTTDSAARACAWDWKKTKGKNLHERIPAARNALCLVLSAPGR